MLVKVLQITEYTKDGSSWKSHDVKDPSWPEIETSIRRLDKFCFPFIWLYLTEETDDLPEFHIIGGKGDYWMAGSVEGYDQRRYSNPNVEEDKEICVWESDQGFSDYDSTICHDLNEVIKATKYFCENGGFDPSISWEEQSKNN